MVQNGKYAAAAEAVTGEPPRDTGEVELGNLAKLVRETTAGLGPGQMSAPVEAGRAVHLFQVVAREEGAVRPFEEVAPELEKDLERGGDQQLFVAWLERRKRQAAIERLP